MKKNAISKLSIACAVICGIAGAVAITPGVVAIIFALVAIVCALVGILVLIFGALIWLFSVGQVNIFGFALSLFDFCGRIFAFLEPVTNFSCNYITPIAGWVAMGVGFLGIILSSVGISKAKDEPKYELLQQNVATAPVNGQPMGMPPYGMPPANGQPPYGMPPANGQPPYGMPPVNGQPPYGQPPYGMPPANGQPPYGQPPYGAPMNAPAQPYEPIYQIPNYGAAPEESGGKGKKKKKRSQRRRTSKGACIASLTVCIVFTILAGLAMIGAVIALNVIVWHN